MIWCTILLAIFLYYLKRYLSHKYCTLDCFRNSVIFITGGSSGIGEALTKRMVSLGAKKVIIASRNLAEMDRVRKESGAPLGVVECVQLDISKPEEAMRIISEKVLT